MKAKDYIINGCIKKIRKIRKERNEKRAGFKSISAIQAYYLEDKITLAEKRHYCERKAYAQLKYFPDLDNPKSYNEKLIFLALYYKNPIIKICSDKYEFKKYLIKNIDEKYIVPTLGVFQNVNDIDFNALPERFVIKSTAGWAGKQVLVVNDKKTENIDRLKSYATSWLYPWNTYYYNTLCTTADKITPRIIIEPNLNSFGASIKDYKIFCFNGRPQYMLIVSGRGEKNTIKAFYDVEEWKLLPIKRNNTLNGEKMERPDQLEEMLEISKKLSSGIPLVRVDFFIIDRQVFVGEMTFYPGMFLNFNPKEWDYKWGEQIDLGDLINDKKNKTEN